MVWEGLKGYLDRSGLEKEDIPRVIGAFVTAKYCTYAAAVALGIRYQPLRRVFLTRRQALGGQSAEAAVRSWALRQQPRILDALSRARNTRLGDTQHRFGVALDNAKNRFATARSRYAVARSQVKSRYRDARGRLSAGRELLRRHHEQNKILQKLRAFPKDVFAGGWYAWLSRKYWQLSEKLEKAATSSRTWNYIGSTIRIKPRALAMGLAEGTILNKLTFPLYAPLELWIIVEVFRHRRRLALCSDMPDDGTGSVPAESSTSVE